MIDVVMQVSYRAVCINETRDPVANKPDDIWDLYLLLTRSLHWRRSVEVDMNSLDVAVVGEGVFTKFSADTAVAKRKIRKSSQHTTTGSSETTE